SGRLTLIGSARGHDRQREKEESETCSHRRAPLRSGAARLLNAGHARPAADAERIRPTQRAVAFAYRLGASVPVLSDYSSVRYDDERPSDTPEARRRCRRRDPSRALRLAALCARKL